MIFNVVFVILAWATKGEGQGILLHPIGQAIVGRADRMQVTGSDGSICENLKKWDNKGYICQNKMMIGCSGGECWRQCEFSSSGWCYPINPELAVPWSSPRENLPIHVRRSLEQDWPRLSRQELRRRHKRTPPQTDKITCSTHQNCQEKRTGHADCESSAMPGQGCTRIGGLAQLRQF